MNKTNNFAVTSGDVGVALQQSASIFNTAGIDMNEGISYIVAANESVQNASKVGTALKTITANLQGVKTSAKDGSISLNKTALALQRIGISVKDDQGNIRSTSDLLSDLGKKWDDLSTTDKSAVSEAIAGKNHINTLQALMNNWDTVIQYQKEYNEGAMVGSAAKENKRYIDSIEGKLAIAKENITQIITTVASTDMFKNLLDGVNQFLESLNKIVGILDGSGVLQALVIGGGRSLLKGIQAMGTEGSGGVTGFWTTLSNYWKEAQLRGQQLNSTISTLNTNASNVVASTSGITTQGSLTNSVFNNLNQNASQTSSVFGNLSENANKTSSTLSSTSLALQRYNSASASTGKSTTQVSQAFQTLGTNTNAVGTNVQNTTGKIAQLKNVGSMVAGTVGGIAKNLLTMGANMVVATAAVWAIQAAFKAVNNKIHETEIAFENVQDAMSETSSSITGYRQKISSLSDLAEQYDELSSKTNRTASEEEALLSLRRQIAEISPDLVIDWDEEGNPLLALNGSLEDYIENLKQLKKLEETKLRSQENTAGRLALVQMSKHNKLSNSVINPGFSFVNADTSFEDINETWYGAIADAEQFSKNYKKILENRNQEIAQKNNDLAESFAELSEYESSAQQYALNKLDTNSTYKAWQDMADDISGSMYSLVNSFDWSSAVVDTEGEQNKFLKGFNKIAEYAKDNKDAVEDWNSTLLSAQTAYQMTGDADAFADSIGNIAKQLEEVTGIDAEDWISGLRGQLEGSLDEEAMRLNEYLKARGSSYTEYLQGSGEATEIHIRFVADNSLADLLTDSNIDNQEKIVQVRAIAEGKLEFEGSPEVKSFIKGVYNNDNKVSEAELSLVTKITTSTANGGGFEGDDASLLKQIMSGNYDGYIDFDIKMSDGTIIARETLRELQSEAKHNPVNFDVKMNDEEAKKVIEKVTENKNHREILMSIKADIKNEEQVQVFDDLITGLQGSKSNIQSLIQANVEGLSKCTTYREMIEYLIDNNLITTECGVTILGKEDVEELSKALDNDKLSEDTVATITAQVERGDLEGLVETLNGIEDEEVRAEVKANIKEALSNLDTIEGKTLNDKFITIKEEGGQYVIAVEEEVSSKSNDESKTVSFDELGWDDLNEKQRMLQNIPSFKQSVVSFVANVSDSLKTWWARLNGSSYDGGGDGSSGGGMSLFKGISSNPFDAESSMSDQIYSATALDMPSVDDGGVFKASATSSEGSSNWLSLGKAKTKDIKINVGMYGTKSLQLGVDLMTTLNNQLKKVENNISLADAKLNNLYGTKRLSAMENMVGSMKEQQRLLKQQYTYETQQAKKLQKILANSYGFKFDSDGNITNYMKQLTTLQNKMESLEKTSGKKKATDKQKNAYDNYKDSYDDAKKYLDEYQKLQFNDIDETKVAYEKLTTQIKETTDEIERIKFNDSIYKYVNSIENLTYKYDVLEETLSNLNAQMDTVHGEGQIKLMEQQVALMKQQQEYLQSTLSTQNKELAQYQKKLKGFGFEFDDLGNITNYDKILNEFQNNIDLEKIKEYSDEYIDLQSNVLQTTTNMSELSVELKELNEEISLQKIEQSVYKFRNAVSETDRALSKLEDELDTIEAKLEYAFGSEKIKLLNQEFSKYDEMLEETNDKLEDMTKQQLVYQKELGKYGFKFNNSGEITNYADALNELQNNAKYDYVMEVLEAWTDLDDEIRDTAQSILSYQNTQKDVLNDKLSLTQDIEDKITEMYEDQLDKRKELLQKQADDEVKLIEKVREEYQRSRDTEDYEESIKEQQDVIAKLNQDIELAKKDTSLNGKAKLEELMKQLEEENKNLQELVKNRQDTLINQMFDDQIDKVNTSSEEKIQELENTWTDAKIAEMVQQALGSQVFQDIDGNVTSLQDAILEFTETSGEAFGVMGEIVQSELVANLQVAYDTIKNLNSIYNELGLQAYGNNDVYGGANNSSSETKNITIEGAEIIVNSGTGDPVEIANQIKITMDEYMATILNRL